MFKLPFTKTIGALCIAFMSATPSVSLALTVGHGVSPQKAAEIVYNVAKNASSTNSALKSINEKTIDHIGATRIRGVYFIAANNYTTFIYSDESFKNVIFGSYHELQKNGDLLDVNTALMLNKQMLSKLSQLENARSNAIIKSVGSTNTKIYIFSDPECSQCAQLNEQILSKLENVEVLIFPVASANPNSLKQKSINSILCANESDQYALWSSLQSGQDASNQTSSCLKSASTVSNTQLAKSLGINNYPSIILPNGSVLTGPQEPQQFVNKLIESIKK